MAKSLAMIMQLLDQGTDEKTLDNYGFWFLLSKRCAVLSVSVWTKKMLLAAPGCFWLFLAASGCFSPLLSGPGCFLMVPRRRAKVWLAS